MPTVSFSRSAGPRSRLSASLFACFACIAANPAGVYSVGEPSANTELSAGIAIILAFIAFVCSAAAAASASALVGMLSAVDSLGSLLSSKKVSSENCFILFATFA